MSVNRECCVFQVKASATDQSLVQGSVSFLLNLSPPPPKLRLRPCLWQWCNNPLLRLNMDVQFWKIWNLQQLPLQQFKNRQFKSAYLKLLAFN
jgi:hypothetical protein